MSTTDPSEAAHDGVLDAKRALRAQVLAARDRMPAATRIGAAHAIATALAARADFQAAPTLLLTLSFGSEWDTAPLFAAGFARHKVVALPRVNLATRLLELCVVTHLTRDVAPGYRGIREPLPHCARLEPDAVTWALVPGVAFDPDGRRLGYGGGFYDRLLPSLAPGAARIAGAFDLQVVDHIPAAAHDLPVDAIVTELRTLPPAR